MSIYHAHADDMLFIKGPFDQQKIRVSPAQRKQEIVMPFGDQWALYAPVVIRGTTVYEFVKLFPK